MKRTAFWKADWVLGLIVAVVLFFASGSDLVQSLERLAYDWGVRASSHAPSTRVAVIAIDDQSIANIGRWPWSREIHAQMIGKLRQAGAKVGGNDLERPGAADSGEAAALLTCDAAPQGPR